jgi:hypothetical protein
MVNVASTRVALCTDYVNLGDPPGSAIGLAHDEPGADGSFTEAMDEGYERQPANWDLPDADGVLPSRPGDVRSARRDLSVHALSARHRDQHPHRLLPAHRRGVTR